MEPAIDAELYQPLNPALREFRLMRVLGTRHNVLSCELATFDLDDPPEYKALSYRWTEASAAETIYVGESVFSIRPNLHNFLRLILIKERVWIFVDAICINQDSLHERSQQVRLMRDIYENAGQVIAWLGGYDESGALSGRNALMDVLGSLLIHYYRQDSEISVQDQAVPLRFSDWFQKRAWLFAEDPNVINVRRQNTSWDNIVNEIFALTMPFLVPEYWSRSWIVQEMLVARELVFRRGALSLNGDTLYKLMQRLSLPGTNGRLGWDPSTVGFVFGDSPANSRAGRAKVWMFALDLLSMRTRFQNGGVHAERLHLYHTLPMLAWQKCSVAYDKVFSILGLSLSHLQADYTMPKLELLIRAMFETILQIDFITLDEEKNRSNFLAIGFSHAALLEAVELDFDHPTVTVTVKRIYEILLLYPVRKEIHNGLLAHLFAKRFRKNEQGMESYHETDDQFVYGAYCTIRLLRFCRRYRSDSLLLPVDETGPKQYDTQMQHVKDIFLEVVRHMEARDGMLPPFLRSLSNKPGELVQAMLTRADLDPS